MQPPSRETVENTMKSAGYAFFTTGSFNLNIVGLRAIPGTPDRFDDLLCVFWREAGVWKSFYAPCTTDPGLYWLQNPSRVAGTAILKPGQYRGAFKLGSHKQSYECLIQASPLPVWRDANRDAVVNYGGTNGEAELIQIHRASAVKTSTLVDRYSAGCQVVANPVDFTRFMDLCKRQITAGMGSRYTYTLLEWAA